jgi:hypothetical protein
MREAFATREQLERVHGSTAGIDIVERCREEMIDLARVVEDWALRYEVASLDPERPYDEAFRRLLRAKAEVIRTDVPRIVEQVLEGRDAPPTCLLAQLEDLLRDGEEDAR